MPIYEYTCNQCGKEFEYLVRGQERATCPDCGSADLEKRLSVPATPSVRQKPLPIASGGGCGRPECAQGRCMGLEN
jgi:putative FmdB family regulatory protein